jgi:hypothetical protein
VKDDLAIIQWIYQRVSTEIFNIVFRDASNATALWAAHCQLFQDNVDARVTTLHAELCNTVQGDSKVGVYCLRLKSLTDELANSATPSTIANSSMFSSSGLVNILRSKPPSSP